MVGVRGDHGVVAGGREGTRDVVEVDAQPEHLGDPVAATGDRDDAVVDAAEVAGAQLLDHTAEGQLVGVLGVPEHDAGAGEDELAGPVAGVVDVVVDAEGGPGDRPADRRGAGEDVGADVDGHAGGGLGLAVHDRQVPAALAPEARQLMHPVRRQGATGLGDQTQPGQVTAQALVDEVEGVRHPREDADPLLGVQPPELVVGHRVLGHDEAAPAWRTLCITDRP
ncbi:hypothetical protein ON003_13150 [Janibacter hoylei]|nr:hypothetical protein [Janibacter hoylei]MCW4602447.1 hypothetical protein [Janibacter hoylei]